MADKIWINTFLSLLTIGTILHRLTSLPVDCATRVQKCPLEKDQWTQKNNSLECAANYGYVCLRNSDGYLFETCMAKFPVQANSGNCPILYACKNNKAYLGPDFAYYPCPEDVSGCPAKNHQEYTIQQLYRYPRCFETNFSVEAVSTSLKSTISIPKTTINADYVNEQANAHAILIATNAVLLTVVLCFIFRAAYPRKKHRGSSHTTRDEERSLTEVDAYHKDSEVSIIECLTEMRIKCLRNIIIDIFESETDLVPFLQNKCKKEADRSYPPVSIVDDYERHITLYEIFYVQQENHGEKRARFVFMLAEARYDKTNQCQRISKLWCQTWKKEYLEESSRLEKERNDIEIKYSERSLNEFDFLFYIRMGNVNGTNVSLIDMIQDAYSHYKQTKEQIDDIRMILGGTKCKSLVLLDGLEEWIISEEKKIELSDKGIPNCRDMPNCTIFITMSSGKFKEVEHICRQNFVKVVRLLRMDDPNTAQLTTNYFYMGRKGKVHQSNIPDLTWNHEHLNAVSSFNSAEILNENIFVTSYLNSHMV